MPRRGDGGIQERGRDDGTVAFVARFRAHGEDQSVTLGRSDAMTRTEAEAELRQIIKKVRDGTWQPRRQELSAAARRRRTVRHATGAYYRSCVDRGLKASTLEDYGWRIRYLDCNLGDVPLIDLSVDDLLEFRDGGVAAGLSARSVNSFVRTLRTALDLEIDKGNIDRNIARGPNRTLPVQNTSRSRPYMDYDDVEALLDAASLIEAGTRDAYKTGRRYLIATIFLAGLRVSEACSLTWADWDKRAGTLHVRDSKTVAGIREVRVVPRLRKELKAWEEQCRNTRHDAPLFPNANGGHRDRSNVSRRVINPRLRKTATEILNTRTQESHRPLPEGITAHDGRRTYISWALEAGHNPALVQRQVGHADPKMTLGVYARVSDRKRDPRIARAMGKGG